MASNKVKFGLSNVHAKFGTDTAIALPGAVSLSLDPAGDSNEFYADNMKYYSTVANNGYTGTLEIANIPDAFKVKALGFTIDSDNVLQETNAVVNNEFVLTFEINGDQHARRYKFFRCTVSRPNIAGQTTEAAVTPKTDTLNITCMPDSNGKISAKTTDSTSNDIYNAWFD